MTRYKAVLFSAVLVAPWGAFAQDLNYNYLQGAIAFYPGFEDQDFIGIDARGSVLMTEDIFIFGGLKFMTDDVDLTAAHVGGGYRYGLDQKTDVYGGVTLEYQEVEAKIIDPDSLNATVTLSNDDTSIGVRGGVRHMLMRDLEVAGEIRYVAGDLDYVGYSASAQYFLNRQIGLVGEIDVYDGEMGVNAGARMNF
jgi:opacity protein-like surface antigen